MDTMGGLYIPLICRDQFYYMRVKRQWRYIIYRLNANDTSYVEVDRLGERNSTFEDFKQAMPANQARWVVYDFEYQVTEFGATATKRKMIFIIYCPDDIENL